MARPLATKYFEKESSLIAEWRFFNAKCSYGNQIVIGKVAGSKGFPGTDGFQHVGADHFYRKGKVVDDIFQCGKYGSPDCIIKSGGAF